MTLILTHVSDVRQAFGALLLATSLERFGLRLTVATRRGTLPPPALHAFGGAAPIVDCGPPADLCGWLALFPRGLYLAPDLVAVGDLSPTLAVLAARDGFYPWESERSWAITLSEDPGWGRLAGAALRARHCPKAFGWAGAVGVDFLRDWKAAWDTTDGDAARGDGVLSALVGRLAGCVRPGLICPAMRHWSEIPLRANVGPVLVEASAAADVPAALGRAHDWGMKRPRFYALERLAALLPATGRGEAAAAGVAAG